jgi:hypothetical protein
MGTKDFFKNQTGLAPTNKGAVKDNLNNSLVDVESPAHTKEIFEEKRYLLPDIDYSDPANYVRYGLATDYYNNAFERIQKQYPYDGSAAEKLNFYNSLTPFEKYIYNEKYPKFNGFVSLGQGDWGSGGSLDFSSTTIPQYIRFFGGPHGGNVIDSDVNQGNNLHINLEDGFTIEFWLRKNGAANAGTETPKESLVNIRNEIDTQRFFLYIDNDESQQRVYFHQEHHYDGVYETINTGFFNLGTVTISDNEWRHLAFTFKKGTGATVNSKCYINGQEIDNVNYSLGPTVTPDYGISGSVAGTINGAGGNNIGIGPTIGEDMIDAAGNGKAKGTSYDDFRIWKTERTARQIGLNWFRNVHGGTNTDASKYFSKTSVEENKVDLAVYFKFNEGISAVAGSGLYAAGNEVLSSSAIGDNLIVDYSGRINNGVFVGYDASLNMRSTGSAMVLSGYAVSEEEDPLLFTENPAYDNAIAPLRISGSIHDADNRTALYNNIPQWIIDDDAKSGNELKKLLQIIASYFDTMHSQIEHVKKFREAKYVSSTNKTTDYVSELLSAHGFNVPELFVDPDVLSSIFDQDEKRVFEEKLYNLKNKIYKNIYANLVSIYKSKGTEKAFRNLFRCYGTDDELFKINLYADGVQYEIDDKTYDTLVKKRLVDFSGLRNTADRNAVIYQATSDDPENYGFYPSSSNPNIPLTVEAQIFFPKKPDLAKYASLKTLETASLFGVHSSSLDHGNADVPAKPTLDNTGLGHGDCNFEVQTQRDSNGFAKFVFSSTTGFLPTLSSSYFYDEEKLIYDDLPWNLAVRIYPQGYPFSGFVTSSLGRHTNEYVLNFYGVKTHHGETLAEFDASTTISYASASQFLTGSNKRFYIGADRVDFTGLVNNQTDVKYARFMVWNSYVSNDEIKKHSRNVKNHGLSDPFENAFAFESQTISGSYIPRAETLALNWEFDNFTSSIGTIEDSTSGSTLDTNKYTADLFGEHNNRHYKGVQLGFTSEKSPTTFELIQSDLVQRPDALYGKNTVRIKQNDYEAHQTNKKPVKLFFAFEASQNEVISREILNFFSDVISFNNLYGEQVHQYRHKYKELESFKRFYFSKVKNVAELEKFVNLYKFLDNALDAVIKNLVPASAATSEKIRTVVEDHVLDRHKYVKPYPLLVQEFREDINKSNIAPERQTYESIQRVDEHDEEHVDRDNISAPEVTSRDDNQTPNGSTAIKRITQKVDLQRDREAGIGLSDEAQQLVNRNLSRTSELLRTSGLANPHTNVNLTTGPYVYKVLSQERDRGELVGSTDADTFRSQMALNLRTNASLISSTPYTIFAHTMPVYGLETKTGASFFSNTFSDTTSDGFKISMVPFPTTFDFLSEIDNTDIYGRREYEVRLDPRNENATNSGLQIGKNNLPKELKIYSASSDIYQLAPERFIEIDYIRHDATLASVGKIAKNAQLLEGPSNRIEKFSLTLAKDAVTDEPEIYITSPQIVGTEAAVFGFNNTKPTNLVQEREETFVAGSVAGYNWSGKSLDIIGKGVSDSDVVTSIQNSDALSYNVDNSGYILITSHTIAAIDRVAISRSVDDDDNALYRSIDRGIFRDRTDFETEQLSPNLNLNYKNLNQRRDLNKAYSTPLMNNGPYYRNIGDEIGVSIHNVPPNPRLTIEPVYGIGYNVEYDNGFIQRISQNNYDQRWHRKTNIVRLGEFNNAPYWNSNFYSQFVGLTGQMVNYAPLASSSYNPTDIFVLPHSEEAAPTNRGGIFVGFAGLNTFVNREINVTSMTINATQNNYVNPEVTHVLTENKKLHMYLLNSSGPYSYSLNAARLKHVEPILRNSFYKTTFSIQNSELVEENGITRFFVSPVSSKSRMNKVIVEDVDGNLAKLKYEIFYPSLTDYFDETRKEFIKIPRRLVRPPLESSENVKYLTIFSDRGKELNGHTIKYFDFAEQIYPRRQRNIQILDHYEIDTDFLLEEKTRKISKEINSLGSNLVTKIGNVDTNGFSSWSTETLELGLQGVKVTINDGELMQLNHTDAYNKLGASSSPFLEIPPYFTQTYGYRINHRTRNDTISPNGATAPYKNYETMLSSIMSEHPTKAVVAEYRAETAMEDFFSSGCNQLSSEPSLFGLDYGSDSKKLLGIASYSDEVFELKDIHKQIDKF